MKRLLLSSFLISSLTYGVFAAPVSSADALCAAQDFLAARGIRAPELRSAAGVTRTAADDAPYHIFNLANDGGFVIVAGDDRLPSVIGYSFQGNLHPEAMPVACAAWLDANAEAPALLPDAPAAGTLVYPEYTVTPLLSTRWDQTDPYNRLCPIDKSTGLRSSIGCVATAAAQVMAYHRYPAAPSGKVEYEDNIQNETRTFDFSAMPPIDWNLISDTYTPASSPEECDAVASLCNAVAHGSRMQFSSDTSLSYLISAGQALIDFFGYSPMMHYYERALVSDQEWINIIAAELAAGRPVLYEGKNHSMGHAFVCDGYDGQGYFHINWGWSGLSDGYFSLSALTPPSQSTGGSDSGYSLMQSILCNIAPRDTPGLGPQETGLLNIDKLYFRDSAQFHYAADIPTVSAPKNDAQLFFYSFNKGLRPFTGEVCAAITDGDVVTPVATTAVEGLGSRNYSNIRFPLASLSLADGTYRIGFFYRLTPDGVWHPISASTAGAPSQCYVTLSGDKATMTAITPAIAPEKTQALSTSRLYTNADATLGFRLANSGSMRLEGYAGVAFMNRKGELKSSFSTPVLCPAYDAVDVEIEATLKGLPAGEYLLMPFYSYSGNPAEADIIPLADQPIPAVMEGVVLMPASGGYFMIDPDRTRLDFNITNLAASGWSAPVTAEIMSQSGTPVASLPAMDMTLAPSGTSSFSFDCSGFQIAKGSYSVRFLIADERPVLLAEIPLLVTADIADVSSVEADGIEVAVAGDIRVSSPEAILAISLYDTSGRILAEIRQPGCRAVIPASGLPKGIYLLRIATENGKTATRKLKI